VSRVWTLELLWTVQSVQSKCKLVDQTVAFQRAVEFGVFFESSYPGLNQEGEHHDFHASLFVFFVGRDAEGFEVGDVGIVVVGDG